MGDRNYRFKKTMKVLCLAFIIIGMIPLAFITVRAINGAGYGIDETSYVGSKKFGGSDLQIDGMQNFRLDILLPENATAPKVTLTLPAGLSFVDKGTLTNNVGTVSGIVGDGVPLTGTNVAHSNNTVTYTIPGGGVTAISISGTLKADANFYPQSFDDDIVATVFYDGSVQDTQTIDGFTLTHTKTLFLEMSLNNKNVILKLDENKNVSINRFAMNTYVNELKYKITPTSITNANGVTTSDMRSVSFPSLTCNLTGVNFAITPTGSGADWDGSYWISLTSVNRLTGYPHLTLGIQGSSADFTDGDKINYTCSDFSLAFYGDNNNPIKIKDNEAFGNFSITFMADEQVMVNNTTLTAAYPSYDRTYICKASTQEDAYATLGSFVIANKKVASDPKEVIMKFNSTDISVKEFPVYIPYVPVSDTDAANVNSIASIEYKYKDAGGGIHEGSYTPAVPITSTSSTAVSATAVNVNYVALGIPFESSIMEVTYKLTSIPTYIASPTLYYYGTVNNITGGIESTIEVRDQDYDGITPGREITTGEGTCTTTTVDKAGGLYIGSLGTPLQKTVPAGSSLDIAAQIISRAWNTYTPNTIFYIRSESEGTIALDTIRVTDNNGMAAAVITADAVLAGADPTGKVVVSYMTPDVSDTTAKQIIKVDMTHITDGSMAIYTRWNKVTGKPADTKITINWRMDTAPTAAAYTQNYATYLYAEDPSSTAPISTYASKVEDPYKLRSVVRPVGTMTHVDVSYNYNYSIIPKSDLLVDNFYKYENEDQYRKYLGNGTEAVIGDRKVDVKVDFVNLSGVKVDDAITYIPIPKKGENWGSLMKDSGAFPFSVNLSAAVPNPAPDIYTIYYGTSIAPGDSGTALNAIAATNWTTTYQAADSENYNCIKIVAKDIVYDNTGTSKDEILAKNTASFVMTILAPYDALVADGEKDIYKPLFYENLTTSAGSILKLWQEGSTIALTNAFGQIAGNFWNDDNIDGANDTGNETALAPKAGWKVYAYQADRFDAAAYTANPISYIAAANDAANAATYILASEGTTDSNGVYSIKGLNRNVDYVLVAQNQDTTKFRFTGIGASSTFRNMLFTGTAVVSAGKTIYPYAIFCNGQESISSVTPVYRPLDLLDNPTGAGIYDVGVRPLGTGSIELSNTVSGTGLPPAATDYIFTISQGTNTIAGKYKIGDGAEQDIPANGQIALKAGETATLSGLDVGTYLVTETTPSVANYDSTKCSVDGAAASFATQAACSVTKDGLTPVAFENIYLLETKKVAGIVWIDANNDGVRDGSEIASQEVTVKLFTDYGQSSENMVSQTTTDGSGYYVFPAAPLGEYTLEITLPSGYIVATAENTNANTYANVAYTAPAAPTAAINTITVAAENLENEDAGINEYVTVTYDGNTNTGGTAPVDNALYLKNQTVSALDQGTLLKEGHRFVGWSSQPDGGEPVYAQNDTFAITQNTTLYAKWEPEEPPVEPPVEPEECTVTFESNGGSIVTSQIVEKGNLATKPEDPTKEDHTFAGWYTDNGTFAVAWDFASDTVNVDITLYAKWESEEPPVEPPVEPEEYTVTFESNGGSIVASQIVEKGSLAAKPEDPTKADHTFAGWYTDNGTFAVAWDFAGDTVISDITLYAKWEAIEYTVVFESNGGSAVASQSVALGALVTKPGDPTKAGHTFAGWYTDNGTFAAAWDFAGAAVTSDITLYAKWEAEEPPVEPPVEPEKYTVTFESNGGSAVASQTVAKGSLVTKPSDPTKAGHLFMGWYTDDGTFTAAWDFASAAVTGNLTLYAKWVAEEPPVIPPVEPEKYTVTFESNGGSAVASQIVAKGSLVTKPADPTRAGYTFAGWYKDDKTFKKAWNFASETVTRDITLYAKWTKVENPKPNRPGNATPAVKKAVSTGDSSQILMYLVIAAAAMLVVIIIFIKRRKK